MFTSSSTPVSTSTSLPASRMAQEARFSPVVLRSEAARWQREALDVIRLATGRSTAVLVGRGSSGNVCTFGSYLLALQTGRQPIEFRPWLTTQTLPDSDWSDSVVYAYSFSGNSADVAASAEWLRARGALIVAVTGAESQHGHLLQAAHHVIRLGCGLELAVPATKSVIAQLFIAAALAGAEITQAAEQTAACKVQIEASGVAAKLADFSAWRAHGHMAGAPAVAGRGAGRSAENARERRHARLWLFNGRVFARSDRGRQSKRPGVAVFLRRCADGHPAGRHGDAAGALRAVSVPRFRSGARCAIAVAVFRRRAGPAPRCWRTSRN